MAMTETEQLIFAISAETTALRRGLQRAGIDIKGFTDNSVRAFDKTGSAATRMGQSSAKAGAQMRDTSNAARQAATNLSFQLNDIAQGLMAGTSPFTLMIQQTTQVTQALQIAGQAGGTMGATLASAFRQFLNPMALVAAGFIGLAAYAYKYFTTVDEGDKEAQKAFKEETDLLSAVADKWGDLVPAIKEAAKAREEALARKDVAAATETALADRYQKLTPILDDINKALKEVDAVAARSVAQTEEQKAAVFELASAEENLNEAFAKHIVTGSDIERLQVAIAGVVDITSDKYAELVDLLAAARKQFEETAKADVAARRQGIKATNDALEKQKEFDKAIEAMREIAKPMETEFAKLWKTYSDAVKAAAGDVKKLAMAQGELIDGLNRIQDVSLRGLADASDIEGYSAKVAHIESGGDPNAKNPRSSASGLFQFTNKTFYGIARAMKEFAGMTKQQIMAQKNNVDAQKIVFEEFTRQNEVFLRKHGIEINDATKYLAHFLGQQGAVDIISGKRGPNKAEIAANPFLAGMSNQQIVDWASKKMGGAAAQIDIKDQRESTELAEKEAVARGEVGKGYDKQVAKQEEAVKFAELMSRWDSEHAGATKAQREEYEKVAKIEAERFGKLKGEEAGTKQFETVEKTIQAMRDETAVIEQQTPAHEGIALALDQEAIAREANALALEKETSLRRAGTAVTEEQKSAILAAATAQVTAQATLKAVNKEQTETNKATAELVQQMSQLAQSAIGGFIQDLRNGVSAGEAFNNMLNRIIDSLINMALQSVFDPKSGIFSFLGIGGVGAAAGGTVGLSRHTDGRRFPPAMWANAPHMQQGGLIGRLRPGEVPIIAHKGELIVPANAVRKGIHSAANSNNGGGNVTNNIGDVTVDMAGTGLVASSSESGKLLGRQIQTAVQVVLVRESRPGGILRKGAA